MNYRYSYKNFDYNKPDLLMKGEIGGSVGREVHTYCKPIFSLLASFHHKGNSLNQQFQL